VHTANIDMVGSYTLANFHFATDSNGGTLVTDPPVVSDQSTSATATIAEAGTLELGGASAQNVAFLGDAGTLKLDASTLFAGQISGLAGEDDIDLSGIAFGANSTIGYVPNGGNTEGMLSVTNGSQTANIALLGSYMASSFAFASDGHGGTLIADQLPGQQALLVPHVIETDAVF
jgi:hypothetical protein